MIQGSTVTRFCGLAGLALGLLAGAAEAALIPGAGIRGRVVWANGPDAGTGVPDINVDCRAVSGQYPLQTTTTDAQGNYQFTALPPGTYELNAIVVCREYMWPRNVTVTIGSSGTVTADLQVWHNLMQPVLTLAPLPGYRGNDVGFTIDLDIAWCDTHVDHVQATARTLDGRHEVPVVDTDYPGAWTAATETAHYCVNGQERATYQAQYVLDSTRCYNETYNIDVTLTVTGAADHPATVTLSDRQPVQIRNTLIKDVVGNAGNPDYVLFDPDPESEYNQPTVSFTIEDEGNFQGHYEYTVFLRDAHLAAWTDYAWLGGTIGGPGPVTVTFNQPGGPSSGALTEWGDYSLEVLVRELKPDGLGGWVECDQQYQKWPYQLYCPAHQPWSAVAGHRAYFVEDTPDHWELRLDYYLHDTGGRDATAVLADVVDPYLDRVTTVENLPCATDTEHTGLVLAEFDESELEAGSYLVVIRGVDAHGTDSPEFAGRNRFRESEHHRMLAINDRATSPVEVDLEWAGVSRDQEEMPGAAVLLNHDDDDEDGVLDSLDPTVVGDNELLKLRVRRAPPTGALLTMSGPAAGKVRVWDAHQSTLVTIPPAGLSVTPGLRLYVEGTTLSDAGQDLTFQLSAGSSHDLVCGTIVGVTAIRWEARTGNRALEPNQAVTVSYLDDPTHLEGKVNCGHYATHPASSAAGLRIFPEALGPNETGLEDWRRSVDAVATVSPAPTPAHPLPDVEVHFWLYDPDDTSAGGQHTMASGPTQTCLVDPNDADQVTGDDNRAPEPEVEYVHLPHRYATLGERRVRLECGRPGDNYRVAATVLDDKIGRCALDELQALEVQYDTTAAANPATTPLLTVWRTLHVDVDSMGEPDTPDYVPVAREAQMVGGALIVSFDDDAFNAPAHRTARYNGGHLEIVGKGTYEITESVNSTGPYGDHVKLSGAPDATGVVGQECRLWDDDQAELPFIVWPERINEVFHAAFVDVVRSSNRTAPWAAYHENVEDDALLRECVEPRRGPRANPLYWFAYVQMANDAPSNSERDPDDEMPIGGKGVFAGVNSAMVFRESCREYAIHLQFLEQFPHTFPEKEQATMMHEIAHLFGAKDDDDDNNYSEWGIMRTPGVKDMPMAEATVVKVRGPQNEHMDDDPVP